MNEPAPMPRPHLLMLLAPIVAPLITSVVMLVNDERRRKHEKHLAEQQREHDAKQREADRITQVNLENMRKKKDA